MAGNPRYVKVCIHRLALCFEFRRASINQLDFQVRMKRVPSVEMSPWNMGMPAVQHGFVCCNVSASAIQGLKVERELMHC